MNTHKPKTNWIVDAILFSAFLIAFVLDLTGLPIHQWLGVGVGALAAYHLWAHRDWVEAVSGRFFGRTSAQARLYYLIDAALFLGLALIVLSGLVISTWFALPLENYAAWKELHVLGSYLTLAVIVLKIGLHWRWVVAVGRKFTASPLPPAREERAPRPAAALASPGRREFLKLMGVVGAAAALAAIGSLDALVEGVTTQDSANPDSANQDSANQDSANQDSASQDAANLETSGTSATSSGSYRSASGSGQSSTACTVQCNRRCSFPGHCRRYVDSNGNGRCDLGECA